MLRLLLTLGLLCLARAVVYYDEYGGYYSDSADGFDTMSDWSKDPYPNIGRFNQPKCVDIPSNLTLCRNIGYTQMRLPNLLDHDTINEVTQQAKSWGSLLGIRCHPDTKLFLCSLFSPVCLERTIWPCRSLCEDVKASCEGIMNKYNFVWPEMLRCDKFPLDNDLCIGLQTPNKPNDTICEACNKPDTFEGILDNFCSSEFVMRIRIDEHVISGGDIKITLQGKKRVYKNDLSKQDLRSLVFYIQNGAHCECGLLDDSRRKQFLIMGRKVGDKLKVTYIAEYDRKGNKDLKRALRTFRKNENICDDINILTHEKGREVVDSVPVATPAPANKPERNSRRKNGNKKKVQGNEDGDNKRKGRKRNKGARKNDNAMTQEERRRRREEQRQRSQVQRRSIYESDSASFNSQ